MWVYYTLWPARWPDASSKCGVLNTTRPSAVGFDDGDYGAEAAWSECAWMVPGTVSPD